MKLRKIIKNSIRQYLNESSTELVRQEMQNAISSFDGEISGRILNKQQREELQKEIENKYIKSAIDSFNPDFDDIRQKLFNYETPYFSTIINGIELRVADGLVRDRKKTYLLYADGLIIGEFFSPPSKIEQFIRYLQKNIIPNSPRAIE